MCSPHRVLRFYKYHVNLLQTWVLINRTCTTQTNPLVNASGVKYVQAWQRANSIAQDKGLHAHGTSDTEIPISSDLVGVSYISYRATR